MKYFSIGKIAAAFGTDGEMILQHSLGKKNALKDVRAIFLEDRKNAFLPYFVESIRPKSLTDLYIKLEDISSREAARKFLQKEVWLEEADFKGQAAAKSPLSLLGYTLIQQNEVLGEIEEIIEQPHQVLCRISYKGNDALIPLHEKTLVSVNHEQKQVEVDLPDGLLDLYAGV